MKFYPLKRAENVLAMLKGGGGDQKKSFGVVFMQKLEVLAILKGGGGVKKIPPFKMGARKVLPCLERGGGGRGEKVSGRQFSNFVATPSPHLMTSPLDILYLGSRYYLLRSPMTQFKSW